MVVLVIVYPIVGGTLEQGFGHPAGFGVVVVLFDQLAAVGVFRCQALVGVEVPGGFAVDGFFDPLAVGVVGVFSFAVAVFFDFYKPFFVVVAIFGGVSVVCFARGVSVGVVAEGDAGIAGDVLVAVVVLVGDAVVVLGMHGAVAHFVVGEGFCVVCFFFRRF